MYLNNIISIILFSLSFTITSCTPILETRENFHKYTTSPGKTILFFRAEPGQAAVRRFGYRELQLSKNGSLVIDPVSPVFSARLEKGVIAGQIPEEFLKGEPSDKYLHLGPKVKSTSGTKGIFLQDAIVSLTDKPPNTFFLVENRGTKEHILVNHVPKGVNAFWVICETGKAEWALKFATLDRDVEVYPPNGCIDIALGVGEIEKNA